MTSLPPLIPFISPVFPAPDDIAADFATIIDSNWYTNFGPFERRFRERIEQWVGAPAHAATFANATVALMSAAVEVFGKGDGRRIVLIPSYTFAAGAEAIEWAGHKAAFIDIDEMSLQPSVAGAREALERYGTRVAGVLLCNSFGIANAQIDAWEALCQEYSVPLLVDSAAGFGSTYRDGTPLGLRGSAEVFSFHATKPMAIGEGGAVLTRDPELAARLRSAQNFGFEEMRGAQRLGLNGKLQEINAAIGLRQLDVLGDALSGRRAVLERYRQSLEPMGWTTPTGIADSSVCFATMIAPSEADRDGASAALAASRIEARHYYSPPVHEHAFFADRVRIGDLAVTRSTVGRVLSLPVHQAMSAESTDAVVAAVVQGSNW